MKQIFMTYWIEMMLVLHMVFCTISLYELFAESHVSRKFRAACLIILFPLVGILIFEKSRKKWLDAQANPSRLQTGKPA